MMAYVLKGQIHPSGFSLSFCVVLIKTFIISLVASNFMLSLNIFFGRSCERVSG